MKAKVDIAEEALREREITFATLAKVAPVGIMRFDARGRCNYVNDRWTTITGLTIDEAIGDGWRKAVHPGDRAAVMKRWRRMCTTNELFREEYRVRRPDGAIRWVLAEGAALRGYARQLLGFIRTITDITRHREMETELMTAREQLEQRVRERTTDLKAEMIERERLEKEVLEIKDKEQRRFSRDLHDGLGQCLTGMLFHVLALERDLVTKGSPLFSTASKVAELVNQAINQTHDIARDINPVSPRPDGLVCALRELVRDLENAQTLKCSFQCEHPILVKDNAVATHLYRIAQEAMNNAIKHSKAGQVILRLEKVSNGSALVIADDGIGIPKNETRNDGRGLNIMKHRARLIDGMLEIETEPGRGTSIKCVFKKGSNEESD